MPEKKTRKVLRDLREVRADLIVLSYVFVAYWWALAVSEGKWWIYLLASVFSVGLVGMTLGMVVTHAELREARGAVEEARIAHARWEELLSIIRGGGDRG